MVYESSYESGRQPFLPDTKRGNWLSPQDFIYAGISLVFRIDIISMSLFASFDTGVLVFIPIYLLGMAIYTVPLMVLQSYMGQFSSSGFISAFRLSPIFKGIGYVSLITNIFILAYHSIFAMVPLLYMFVSFNPTLPWSCDGFKTWAQNLTESEEINLCNVYIRNETEPSMSANDTSNETSSYVFINHHIPSVLYFQYLFHDLKVFHYDDFEFSMSWQLILCALMVWVIIGVIVYKFFQTEVIGTIVRYSVMLVLGLMCFFLIGFSFLPGTGNVFRYSFTMHWRDILPGIITTPMHGMSVFGPGWGIYLTLSSFNKFRTNVVKQSCLIALGQFVVYVGMDFLRNLSDTFFYEKTNWSYYANVEHMWILYLSGGSVLTHFPWANLWSILFYFMLFWSSMLLMICGFFIAHYEHQITSSAIDGLVIVFTVIPWLGIPGFAIYQMSRSMGSFKTRFLRCCRPTDWFPIETEEKEKYEQLVGSVEITYTLSELKDEEVI
ncbi:sodium- and chloride-dependent neutral and basic amino acid transporter B(0+)-like [Musca vetustissima]|uniref:sodium- and chloride-dependent neutral and basic amino acid transporter B(0+)-like n=1 Tax=Musca vetustissima TaxID=27455 RepID=UPI002AB74737|nr:sodium- and chloride-dependent neutral and basic amino acid transporter B(0+)-like [Musca vetustissima]